MPDAVEQFVQSVNERLDAAALVEAIGYHTDRKRVLGRNIKTPCMLHGDERFATLLVDPDRRTGKCLVSTCPAWQGLTLVEIYAQWRGVSPVSAAIGAAWLTGLKLHPDEIAGVREALQEKAATAEKQEEWETAATSLSAFRDLEPDDPETELRFARASFESGRLEDGLEAAAPHLGSAEPEQVAILLAASRRHEPETADAARRLAALHEDAGATAEAAALLRRALELEEAPSARLRAARRIADLAEPAPEDTLAAAGVFAEQGDPDGARSLLQTHGQRLLEQQDDAASALRLLRQAREYASEPDADLDLLVLEGLDRTEAQDEYRELADDLRGRLEEAGRIEEGHAVLRRLAERFPDDAAIGEQTALLDLREGKASGETASRLEALAQEHVSQEELNEAAALLKSLCDSLPSRHSSRQLLVHCLVRLGDDAAAVQQQAELVSRLLESDEGAEACGALKALGEMSGAKAARLADLVRAMAAKGLRTEVEVLLPDLIAAVKHEDKADVLALARAAREIAPAEPAVLAAAEEAFDEAGESNEAAACVVAAMDALASAGDPGAALTRGREALEYYPEAGALHARLAVLLSESGETEEAASELIEAVRAFAASGDTESAREALAALSGLDLTGEQFEQAEGAAADAGDTDSANAFARKRLLNLIAEERLEEAREELDSFLRRAPDDLEARALLLDLQAAAGETLGATETALEVCDQALKAGDPELAVRVTMRIGEMDPAATDARRKAALLLYQYNQHEAATSEIISAARALVSLAKGTEAEKLLDVARDHDPDNPELRRVAVRAWIAAGDLDAAAEELELLAQLFDTHGQKDEALAARREAIEVAPENEPAHRALVRALREADDTPGVVTELMRYGDLQRRQGNALRAAEFYGVAAEADPEDAPVRRAEAEALGEAGHAEQAVRAWGRLAELSLRDEDADAALRAVDRGLQAHPGHILLLTKAFELAEKSGKPVEAADRVRPLSEALLESDRNAALDFSARAAELPGADPMESVRHGGMLVRAGEPGEAALWFLNAARALEDSNRRREATDALRRVEALDGLEPEVAKRAALLAEELREEKLTASLRGKAALSLLEAGDRRGAREMLESLDDGQDAAARALVEAQLLEEEGRGRESAKRYEEAARQLPADHPRRRDALERAARQDGTLPAVQAMLAELLEKEGEPERARAAFVQGAELYISAAEYAEALPLVLAARDLDPEDPQPHRLLGDVQAGLGNDRKAVTEYRLAADSFSSRGDHEAALKCIERAIALDDSNQDLRQLYARVSSRTGRRDSSVEAWIELSESDDLEESLKVLTEALEELPDEPRLALRQAELLRDAGRKDEALASLKDVFERAVSNGLIDESERAFEALGEFSGEERPEDEFAARVYEEHGIPELAARHLVALAAQQIERGENEEAAATAERATKLHPRSLDAREVHADALHAAGRAEEAAALLEDVAEHLKEAGGYDAAENVMRRLVEMMPESGRGHLALGRLLGQAKQADAAAEELQRAADLLEEAGESALALEALEALLELKPEDTHARRRLIDLGSRETGEREMLPQVHRLADAHRSAGETGEALKLLRGARERDPRDMETLRRLLEAEREAENTEKALEAAVDLARAEVEAGEPRRAQETLEKVKEYGPEDATWQRAMAEVNVALNARGSAVMNLQEAVRIYGEMSRTDRQVDTLRRVVEVDPASLDARRQLADLLRRLGQDEEASAEQHALAARYEERGLHDLAEAEFRRLTERAPRDFEAWEGLIRNHLRIGDERDLVREFLLYGSELAETKDYEKALQTISRAIEFDPENVAAREKYIEVYLKVGPEEHLCEEYLALADLQVGEGNVERGLELYSRIMELDPQNVKARDRLTETQERRRRGEQAPRPSVHDLPKERPHETHDLKKRFEQARREQEHLETLDKDDPAPQASSPMDFLASEVEAMEAEEDLEALSHVLRSYEDILSINPNNANAHVKLADVLEQMGKDDDAVEHLNRASELFFEKGELDGCIACCERVLHKRPGEQRVRLRLKQAFNKRDAFKALESAILFSDNPTDETEG